ncbi:MAG TPA: DUF805 domain-containing protein [Terracidiphilus sp.]|nr:DUF805 domain-containing protein [Terracidiphilus sp.]
MDWYLMVWKKYAEFEGRSRRQEFWMFVLFNLLAMVVLGAVGVAGIAVNEDYGGVLFIPLGIYILAAFIPNLAVSVRRFHDIDKSGWLLLLLILLSMIPFVGLIASIIEIVLLCQPGTPGINQYGADPKFPEQGAVAYAGIPPGAIPAGIVIPPPAPAQPIAAQRLSFCGKCGAALKDGAGFCSSCGAHS